MSLGPRMQDEAPLAAQVQRAALFSTFAKATGMEKRLVRAVTPVMSVTRLVCPGHRRLKAISGVFPFQNA